MRRYCYYLQCSVLALVLVLANLYILPLPARQLRHNLAAISQESSSDAGDRLVDDNRFQFDRKNMLDGVNHRCGTFKCFYPLQFTFHGKRVGYVAGTDPALGQSLWAAYNFSIAVLQEEHGMQHTALKPPQMITFQEQQRQDMLPLWMDQNKTGSNDQPRDDVPRFAGHPQIYVQLVTDVLSTSSDESSSALFWGTSNNNPAEGLVAASG